MAVKVGEAYVEIYGDLDQRRITNESEQAGRLGGSIFGDAFTKETERSFRGQTSLWNREGTTGGKLFGESFTREVHKAVSGLQIDTDDVKVEVEVDVDRSKLTQLETSLKSLNIDMPELNVPITQAMANIQLVKAQLAELGRSTTSHQVRVDVEQAMREIRGVEKNFGVFGEHAAQSFAVRFGSSLHEFFRAFPADTYLRALMTPIGVGLVAIGAPLFTAAGATLGAALGAAIVGAVGAMGLGAGIMIAAADPRVEGAFKAMGSKMLTTLQEATTGIKQHLLAAVGDIQAAFSAIDFKRFFDTLAPLITEFSSTFARLGPQIDDIVQKFAFLSIPIGKAAADFLEKLVPAAERFIDKLAPHMPALQSAFIFIGDVIISLVDLFGDLIAKAAEWYEVIASTIANGLDLFADITAAVPILGDKFGITSEQARGMADNIRNSMDVSYGLEGATSQLASGGLGPLAGAAQEADRSLSGLKDQLKDVNNVVIDQNEAAEQWEETWDRIADSPTKFAGALDIATEAGRKNRDMIQQAAEQSRELALADIAAGVSAEEAAKKHDKRMQSLVDENFQSGRAREEAKQLIEQYGQIPDNVITQIDATGIPDAHAGTHRLIEKYDEVPKTVTTDLAVSNWGETNAQLDVTAGKFDNLAGRAQLAGGQIRTDTTQTQSSVGTSSTGIQQSLQGVTDKTEATKIHWGISWTAIQDAARMGGEFMHNTVLPALGSFFDLAGQGADAFMAGWGMTWSNLGEIVRQNVNKAIEFINGLLTAFKNVAQQFGLNISVGTINTIGDSSTAAPLGSAGGFRGFNRGGYVPGSGNTDKVPALLTPGEGVLTKGEINKLGGPAGFARLRQNIQGYQAGGIVGMNAEQARNAAIIAQVASSMGLGPDAVHIALITAMQESGLRNITFGDRDSVGLFQQRPSQGWGTVQQIMDPFYSARKFFEGLAGVSGWQNMASWQAAQAVQRSAFPMAYAKWDSLASGALGAGGDILKILFKPLFDLVDKLKAEIPNFGGSPFGEMIKQAIIQLIEAGKKWVMDNFSSIAGGGIGYKAMEALIGKLVPGARVSSGLRPGSRGESGGYDYHHYGRAIDIVPSPGPIANQVVEVVNRMFKPVTKELIHTPAGSKQIWNGRNYVFSGAGLMAGHYDHVHWAMDNGGVLPPHSDTVVRNATSSTEFALTAGHMAEIFGAVGGGNGENGVIENHLTVVLDGSVIDHKIQQNDIRKKREAQAGRRV